MQVLIVKCKSKVMIKFPLLQNINLKTLIYLFLDKKSKRLKILVEEIFEASKLSSSEIEFNIAKSRIKELLIQNVVGLEDKIQERRLNFIVDPPDETVFTIYRCQKNFQSF